MMGHMWPYVAMLGRCNDVLGMLYLGGTYDLLRWVLKKHRWLKVQSELKIAEDTIASTFAQSWLWHWESVLSR